jgi:hypothetical protein
LWNLTTLWRFANIKGFIKGTILFQWPWMCRMHPSMKWIISSTNVLVFSTIGDRKVIYPCLFIITFWSNVLILLFNEL